MSMLPTGTISKIHKLYYSDPRYKNEIMRAMGEFFENPDIVNNRAIEITKESEGLFNEWFLYDFVMKNNKTPLENFICKNPLELSKKQLIVYTDLLHNRYGIYEVLKIERGKSMTVKDLQTKEKFTVNEFVATFRMGAGDVFFGRIGQVADHLEFVGADCFSMQDVPEATKKSFFKNKFWLTPQVPHLILRDRAREN